MIKINLATRKQADASGGEDVKVGGLSIPGGLSRAALNLDMNQLKDLPIKKFLLPLIVVGMGWFFLDGYKIEELDKADAVIGKLNAERATLTAEAGKVRGYEEIKKVLEGDERTLRTKIETIQKLIADRTNPPKILLSLANATPKDVWLSEFKMQDRDVTFRGYSLGFGQISDFMRNLTDNAYFTDLNINETKQALNEGLDVAAFELSAKRR